MARVSDFVRDEATCSIPVGDGGEKLTITYRPSRITADSADKLQRYIDERDALAFARHFVDIVVDWDLEGPLYGEIPVLDERGKPIYDEEGNEVVERKSIVDAGQIVPLKAGVLKYMPQAMMNHVYQELNNDMSPDPQRGRGSRRR